MSYIGSKPADAVLETDDITDGIITTSKLADNSVTTAKTSYQDAPFRNIIINGSMDIAQRGTSFTGLTNGNNSEYTLDRFNFSESGSESYVFTVSQSTDVPSGQGFSNSLKYLVTTADTSLDSLGGVALNYRIEGQHLQYLAKGTSNAKKLTLSFWFKSSLTGTYIAELFDKDNNRTISKAYTVNTANTWEKKTITFDADTTGTIDNDNARSMDLTFWFSAGSGYQSGTLQTSWGTETTANRVVGQVDWSATANNELYITGIQLEAGETASDFEFLPVDVNLARCQRYYEVIRVPTSTSLFVSYTYSGSEFNYWQFKTHKRASATISLGSSATANGGTITFFPGFDACQLYRATGIFYVQGVSHVVGLIAEAEL